MRAVIIIGGWKIARLQTRHRELAKWPIGLIAVITNGALLRHIAIPVL